jgi:secondary thiamine-phosphate synthase enzyme
MKTFTKIIDIETHKDTDIIDLTPQVKGFIKESKVKNGIATVYSKHTTAAIRINENEACLHQDIKAFFENIAPKGKIYNHDDFEKRVCPPDERKNGHSHLLAMFLGASETIPIIAGELTLGIWQSIFFMELDGGDRKRQVIVQIIGE